MRRRKDVRARGGLSKGLGGMWSPAGPELRTVPLGACVEQWSWARHGERNQILKTVHQTLICPHISITSLVKTSLSTLATYRAPRSDKCRVGLSHHSLWAWTVIHSTGIYRPWDTKMNVISLMEGAHGSWDRLEVEYLCHVFVAVQL